MKDFKNYDWKKGFEDYKTYRMMSNLEYLADNYDLTDEQLEKVAEEMFDIEDWYLCEYSGDIVNSAFIGVLGDIPDFK